jgi:hypothetical protein
LVKRSKHRRRNFFDFAAIYTQLFTDVEQIPFGIAELVLAVTAAR